MELCQPVSRFGRSIVRSRHTQKQTNESNNDNHWWRRLVWMASCMITRRIGTIRDDDEFQLKRVGRFCRRKSEIDCPSILTIHTLFTCEERVRYSCTGYVSCELGQCLFSSLLSLCVAPPTMLNHTMAPYFQSVPFHHSLDRK